jgi:predicted RNase H-like HicB family nuclease
MVAGRRSFTVEIERDPDSGWLVAEVKQLPGCYTQAPDMNALQDNILAAISVYLKSSELALAPMDVKHALRIEKGTYDLEMAV